MARRLKYSGKGVGVLTWARRLEYLDRGWSTFTGELKYLDRGFGVPVQSTQKAILVGLEVRENIISGMGIGE